MKRISFFSILVIAFSAISACQSQPSKETDTPMKTGKITYSVEYAQQQKGVDISPLYLKLAQLDLPMERAVYFDGEQSSEQEITDVFGIRLKQLKLRKKGNSDTFQYAESQPHFSGWTELQESRPVNEEKTMSIVTFLKGEKTILGYRCKKATIEEEHYIYTVWYTTELTINDPTGAVLQFDSIPGLILEMDRAFSGEKLALIIHTKVTSIDLDVNEPTTFDLPKDAVHVKNIDEMNSKNQQSLIHLMEKEQQQHPLTEAEKSAFEGTWVLSYQGDRIELNITKNADKTSYIIQETKKIKNEPEETQSYKAVFYGETLFVDLAPTFLRYQLTPKGDLKLEKGDFFVFKKQS
ncbi:MAG: hypothetical protein V4604_17660 [Bacteroidota bacterium]